MNNPILMQFPEELKGLFDGFQLMKCRYECALREVRTKLEILDKEFEVNHSHNPIHHMESRVKSPKSIGEKLVRKGYPLDINSASHSLYDIAGMRVVCPYLQDVYSIAELLTKQDDIRLIRERDYIKNPKGNGYRSLHLVVEIPVFFSSGKTLMPVEVQIRTIAMDFWASLEHQIRYKETKISAPEELNGELKQVASKIAMLDEEMQSIRNRMVNLVEEATQEMEEIAE